MNQAQFLYARGFRQPFRADAQFRGVTLDAANQVAPIGVSMNILNHVSRLVLAHAVAKNLNREAEASEAGRAVA